MRVILAGGGTGGHLYPAIAMAREILKRNREAAVLFVGTSEGIESRILPKEGLALRTIRIRGLKRKKPAEQLVAVLGFPIALVQSVIILRGFRPDAVIGVGGYAWPGF
jgi:UDP-N-acetylglucosamine--N-acetylmuramyl-(pentapeptide) pyrophosphoryl-undecaprenol N-acetylglucosamine transferase